MINSTPPDFAELALVRAFCAAWEIAANGATVLTVRIDRFVINGQPIALPVMGTFEMLGGKIAAWRDYFALADDQRQLGPAGAPA